MQFAYFIKTGSMLSENENPTILTNIIPQKDWKALNENKDLSLPTLLKLLVLIVDYMQNHPFFLFKNVVRIPYYMAENNHFKIKFDFTDNSFNIFTTQDLAFSSYESIRLEFDFCFILDQLVDFEANKELEMFVFSCASPAPPYHCFSELIAHSLIRQDFVVKAGSRLGKLKILSLNTKVKFVPLQIQKKVDFQTCQDI